MLADLIATASLHWPQSPCRGREHVKIVNEARMDELSGGKPRIEAWALGRRCEVLISPGRVGRQPRRQICRLLVHEFGHLAGRRHSTRRNSVMFPVIEDLAANAPECRKYGTTVFSFVSSGHLTRSR
jgi:hypothetical protein